MGLSGGIPVCDRERQSEAVKYFLSREAIFRKKSRDSVQTEFGWHEIRASAPARQDNDERTMRGGKRRAPAAHFPVVFQLEDSRVFSAYVAGLAISAQAAAARG